MLYSVVIISLFSVAILLIGSFSYAISRNIKKSSYVSSTYYGELVQLLQDKHELHRFGYGQYLKRGYSDFNAFHMSFMNMGIVVSLVFLANYIFANVSISYALLIFISLSIFYLLTSVANAQLLANQPTAGGLYHVLFKQVGSIWASFVGVIKLIAQLATTILYSFFVVKLISLLFINTYSFMNEPLVICIGVVLVIILQAIIANLKSSLTRWMQGIGILLFWGLLIFLCLAVFIFILPSGYSPFHFLVGETPYITSSQLNPTLAFSFVALLLAKCFVGHDEGAANAEETIEPKIKIPWATYLSTSYTVIFGFVFLILVGIIYFNVTNASYVPANINDWLFGLLQLPAIIQYGIILFLLIVSWYNGLFSIVNGSRHIMAMARDIMFPFAHKLANITLIRQTPHYAIIAFALLSSIGGLSFYTIKHDFIFITQLTVLIVAAYSFTYAITLFFSYFKHEHDTVWKINRGQTFIRIVAIVFNIIMTTVSLYFLSWKLVLIVAALACLNTVYTYLKHGFFKLNIQKTMKKNEFNMERNFPLQ